MTNVNVTLKPANGIRVVLVPPDETEVTLNRMYLYDKTVTDKAKEWAIKMDGKVQEDGVDVDYSSKYYATESKNSETLASGYAESASTSAGSASDSATLAESHATNAGSSATNARKWAEGTDEDVDPLGGEHSAKGWAEAAEDAAESIIGVLSGYEQKSNKVTEVDDDSTDTQYPSAKAVYNVQLDLEDQLDDEARIRTRMDNQLSDRINNAYNFYVPKTRTINGNALSSDITLTASDVGALPDSTVIPTDTSDLTNGAGFITSSAVNNSTINITQGGVSKGSFTLNQSTGATIALDAGGGSSYTAGTGIDITNDVISVTEPTLIDNGTGFNGLAVRGSATGTQSVALGFNAKAQSDYAIQLGRGTNNEGHTFYVGLSTVNNYKLLGSDGKIPDDRLNCPIPSQTGSSGKFLTTDGTSPSWADVDALPSQAGHSGKYLTTDGETASWETVDALPSQSGQSGKYLTTNGTVASWDMATKVTIRRL